MQILVHCLLWTIFGDLKLFLHVSMSVKLLRVLTYSSLISIKFVCADAIVVWWAWSILQSALSHTILAICLLGTTSKSVPYLFCLHRQCLCYQNWTLWAGKHKQTAANWDPYHRGPTSDKYFCYTNHSSQNMVPYTALLFHTRADLN